MALLELCPFLSTTGVMTHFVLGCTKGGTIHFSKVVWWELVYQPCSDYVGFVQSPLVFLLGLPGRGSMLISTIGKLT